MLYIGISETKMKFLFKLSVLLIIVTLNSCSKSEKEISSIQEIDQEDEMILAYREGIKNLDEGDAFYAAKKFLEAELLFPQSRWAAKSSIMAAYSYYSQNYYLRVYNLQEILILI